MDTIAGPPGEASGQPQSRRSPLRAVDGTASGKQDSSVLLQPESGCTEDDVNPNPNHRTMMLRRAELCRQVGLHPSTIFRMCRRGTFPAPLRIGARAVAWRLGDVEDWLAERATTRTVTELAVTDSVVSNQ